MTTSLSSAPGQVVTLFLQTLDGYGELADGYQAPMVDLILLPSGSLAAGYPSAMTEISTGLYKYSFTLASGLSALGNYLASVSWPHPTTGKFQNEIFVLSVNTPFGASLFVPG